MINISFAYVSIRCQYVLLGCIKKRRPFKKKKKKKLFEQYSCKNWKDCLYTSTVVQIWNKKNNVILFPYKLTGMGLILASLTLFTCGIVWAVSLCVLLLTHYLTRFCFCKGFHSFPCVGRLLWFSCSSSGTIECHIQFIVILRLHLADHG